MKQETKKQLENFVLDFEKGEKEISDRFEIYQCVNCKRIDTKEKFLRCHTSVRSKEYTDYIYKGIHPPNNIKNEFLKKFFEPKCPKCESSAIILYEEK